MFAAAFTLGAFVAGAAGADWNQWRGPNRDGVARDFQPPANWTAQSLAKQWTIPVGEGHSSPVVAGDRVYLFARENDQEIMRCVALADGKVIWQQGYAVPYDMNPAARGHGKGPKTTPAVVDGRVFALGINGHVSAYDAKTGSVLWRKEFARDFKSTAPLYGAAASPIVDAGYVIVHVGGHDSGALVALDVGTGALKWKWDADGPAYTSPIIATIGGTRQLITQSQNFCVGISPADGRVLWKHPFTTPYDQNIVTPVVTGDLVQQKVGGGALKEIAKYKVADSPVWAAPAVAGDRILIKDKTSLMMYKVAAR